MNEHWQVIPNGDKGIIALRDDLAWWRKFHLKWVKRTTIIVFYRAVQAWLDTNEGAVFENAIEHGNIRIAPELEKKVDHVFQLKNGWTIERDSLRALTRGPLLNEDGTQILVPSHGILTSAVLWIERWPLYRALVIVMTIVAAILLFY